MIPEERSDRPLITGLQRRLEAELADIVGRGARVAFVDYPYTKNSGDPLIWLGSREVLARLGAEVVYTCETDSYHRDRMAERLGVNGVILLQGGGNFGDYWPQHQHFRETVLRDFPGHRIVQLPQSVAFRNVENVERVKRAMSGHAGFVMCCRDAASAEIASETLTLDTRLVPDAAFGMGPLARPRVGVESEVLVLARRDQERRHDISSLALTGAIVQDWTLRRPHALGWKALKKAPRVARRWHGLGWVDRATTPAREFSYSAMARLVVREAIQQLSRHNFVVTDRLHAHVLCMMLDIPHVVLDNDYGKIRGLHGTWAPASRTTLFADRPADVERLLASLGSR
jgi:exopolysaccharide biosynthesis predicted pyruvyltransferase EpsI